MERKAEHRGERDGSTGADSPAGRLAYLFELEPEIRAAAILDGEGTVVGSLASGRESGREQASAEFGTTAVSLVGAVDDAGSKPFDSCHIALPDAELFLVREGDLSLVAVTERFVLASLVSFDMRMTLRDLTATGGSKSA